MEFVKGEPITIYCERQRFRTAEHLALFIPVCEGPEHAHQKGIIHRNLKPRNGSVTIRDDRPTPKMTDFGVARATARHGDSSSAPS
jgi:eukaryotic-like serine/threonine-protein kinase